MTEIEQGQLSPSDVADLAGVSRAAVSNWRKRAGDFPSSVAGTATKPLFSRAEVTSWLERRGHSVKQDFGETNVWAALNLLREKVSVEEAAELVLSLAVSKKIGLLDASDYPGEVDSKTKSLVWQAIERVADDKLASAADFALERLARAQGRVGGEFGFIGSRTTTLLANLAASRPNGVLYDPACGIGAALLKTVSMGACPTRVIGHDINERALKIAADRAALHEVNVELTATNVLTHDVDPALRADVIVLEPPFGIRAELPARLTDVRYEFGAPPRHSADTAWLQHVVAHLTDQGRGYVLSPPGALFRSGEERDIRAELIRRGCVEAIAALPGKLLPHTSIPLVLWVLRRPVTAPADQRVLFIDASEGSQPEQHLADWLSDAAARRDVPHLEVPIADVLAARSVLTPQTWINRTERDPQEVAQAYTRGWIAIDDTMTKVRNLLAGFKHFGTFSRSRVLTVQELVEQGVLDLRSGQLVERYADFPTELRARIITAVDVIKGDLGDEGIDDDEYIDYPEITRLGDVLLTTNGGTITVNPNDPGGHLLGPGIQRLRVLDHSVLSPTYLSIVLTGDWNQRFQQGAAVPRASVREMEIPLIPRGDQIDFHVAAVAITALKSEAAALADQAATARTALLDAVRYNALLPDPQKSPDAIQA